jgi:hypothetical protein
VDWTRKHARASGILYLITFAASIPAAFYFLTPVLSDPGYIVGSGADTRVVIGCLLDVVNAVACIGTAVAVFPGVKRQNEALALGFVASRMLEASVILIGVVSLLAVVTLRQDAAGTASDPAALATTGQALVAVRDYTFQFGPNLCAAMNALLFGTLLYRSRLVPRVIPTVGLIGPPADRGHRRHRARTDRAGLGVVRRRRHDRRLGVVRGRLHGRQGLQARTDHRNRTGVTVAMTLSEAVLSAGPWCDG